MAASPLKSGDVVIHRKEGVALCHVQTVHDDGVEPTEHGELQPLEQARQRAREITAVTGGKIIERMERPE